MGGRFTKTFGSADPEKLHATVDYWADQGVFFDAPDTNSDSVTIRDEDGTIVCVMVPGTNRYIPIYRNGFSNPKSNIATKYLGDKARVGGADRIVYADDGVTTRFTLGSWTGEAATDDVVHVGVN